MTSPKHLLPKQKKCGSIFVTGADSGMGQATVQYLCQTQNKNNMGAYTTIFVGAYSPEAATLALQNLCGKEAFDKYVKVIPLDVSSDKSVEDAAKAVLAATVTAASTKESDLAALVNYHGIAFNVEFRTRLVQYITQRNWNFKIIEDFECVQKFSSAKCSIFIN